MKTLSICAISDTHEQQDALGDLPDADILVHAGDWTYKGSMSAMESFLTWFSNQPHAKKLFIAGNHEVGLDRGPMRQKKLDLIKSFTDKHSNLYYLEHEAITIQDVKFFGSPFQPFFYDWAFNVQRGKDLAEKWNDIPFSTNVILCHSPVHMILDEAPRGLGQFDNVGCEELAKRIKDLPNLKAVIHGHIHFAAGQKTVDNVQFVNASICTEQYKPTNSPIVIEIEV